MKRLKDLFELLATAWRIWREDGQPHDLEIEVYAQDCDRAQESIFTVTEANQVNAVHFADKRRAH